VFVLYRYQNLINPRMIGRQRSLDVPTPVFKIVYSTSRFAATGSPIVLASSQEFITSGLGPTVQKLPGFDDHSSADFTLGVRPTTDRLLGKTIQVFPDPWQSVQHESYMLRASKAVTKVPPRWKPRHQNVDRILHSLNLIVDDAAVLLWYVDPNAAAEML
jgi:hypothetical protein